MRATRPAHLTLLDFITVIMFAEEASYEILSVFLLHSVA